MDWPNPSYEAWRWQYEVAIRSQPDDAFRVMPASDAPLIIEEWPNPSYEAWWRQYEVAIESQAGLHTGNLSPQAYNAIRNDVVIVSSGTGTVYLAAAATVGSGGIICVANEGVGTVTIDAAGAELINGAATQTLSQHRTMMLISTGSAWVILSSNNPGAL